MGESKELKPKSFRIDDATADKFKEISGQIGGNQQETLAKLIEAYEFQSGKAILTDKKSDIDQFEKYVNALTRMFMGSLEDNQNITVTVRTEFEAQLNSKDAVIQDLQEKLTVAKQLKEEATRKAQSYADENTRLNDYNVSLEAEYKTKTEDLQSMLTDKDNLNKALTDRSNELKEKVDSMSTDHEQLMAAQEQLKELTDKLNVAESRCSELEKDFRKSQEEHKGIVEALKQQEKDSILKCQEHENEALERCQAQMELAREKAVLEAEKRYQEQIQKLKAEKQAEVDQYQAKYLELLEKMQNQEKSLLTTK